MGVKEIKNDTLFKTSPIYTLLERSAFCQVKPLTNLIKDILKQLERSFDYKIQQEEQLEIP